MLAINTSGTLNAAIQAVSVSGRELELHISTHLPADVWAVELRQPTPEGNSALSAAQPGEVYSLPGGARAQLLTPYRADQRNQGGAPLAQVRLWLAALQLPGPAPDYLQHFGFPIRYKYVRKEWPSRYYQTVYADEPGSAEMPSAGRAFSLPLLKHLQKGEYISPNWCCIRE